MPDKFAKTSLQIVCVTAFLFCLSYDCHAKEAMFGGKKAGGNKAEEKKTAEKRQIVVNGDRVEFFSEQKKVVAEGNVIIVFQDSKLTCDKVTVFSDTNDCIAEGNVRLYSPKGNLEGEKLLYNFSKKTGTILGAKLQPLAQPFFGAGQAIEKFSDQHLEIKRGYMTTCDLSQPHYRLSSRRLEMYPGEKIVARDVKFIIGKSTLFYLPRYTQVLNDKRPNVTVVPGYDKRWGFYLLQAWRYYFNENSKGLLHLDYRERKGFALGIDNSYKIPNMGEGLIRTYYTNELNAQSKGTLFNKVKLGPTIDKERFKAEWRHKWQMDPTTNLILQYYKLKDANFVQDYFRREYEKDQQPKSFFLLTRTFSGANLSFDVEKRVNHFFTTTERLPQLKLDTIDQKIGDTRFYFKNQTTYDNISSKTAQPAATDPKGKQTQRVDFYNKFSHQEKISFIESRPYVAVRQTYFNRNNTSETNIIRGIFYTGIDLSTKFYRIFDINTNYLNLDINRLRHIITPTISYSFIHQPTVDSSKFFGYDEIDTITKQNSVTFGLENKLQTKRGGSNVDLLRFILNTDYLFKGYPDSSRFNHVTSNLELTPYKWLTFTSDSDYDTNVKKLLTANYAFSVSSGDEWNLGFGQRYQRDNSNQLTGELAYRFNPLWKFRVYERFEQRTSSLKEQEYGIIRDLHCWQMEINYNMTRGLGNNIWIIFRIKAFPKMGFNFQNSFHRPKFGSQSPTEEQ